MLHEAFLGSINSVPFHDRANAKTPQKETKKAESIVKEKTH